jgi:hypothetical protein
MTHREFLADIVRLSRRHLATSFMDGDTAHTKEVETISRILRVAELALEGKI